MTSHLPSDSTLLTHATAVVGASQAGITEWLASLKVSPFDTIELDALAAGGIKDVRDFTTKLQLSPQFGDIRLGVIFHAEQLTPEAQNALLKLLEEPPARVKLILCIGSEANMLPTVLSRCQVRHVHSEQSVQARQEVKDSLAQFLEVETLAKEDDLNEIVYNRLAEVYQAWCLARRPVEGVRQVEIMWRLYHDLGAQLNKRLLLEESVLSSL